MFATYRFWMKIKSIFFVLWINYFMDFDTLKKNWNENEPICRFIQSKQEYEIIATMNPFCNMCFKAGKSEKEYKSHWLRDRPGPGGVVVCPYLLSIECRYCHEKGHTVSRCPVLANKKRMQHN